MITIKRSDELLPGWRECYQDWDYVVWITDRKLDWYSVFGANADGIYDYLEFGIQGFRHHAIPQTAE